MPDAEELLHDQIDDLETLRMGATEDIREIYDKADPVRLADPDDHEFDVAFFTVIKEVILEDMLAAHNVGAETAETLTGDELDEDIEGEELEKAVEVMVHKLQNRVKAATDEIDEFVKVSQVNGMSAETIVKSIERAMDVAAGVEGVVPVNGLDLVHLLNRIARDLVNSSMTAAARAGQIEVFRSG